MKKLSILAIAFLIVIMASSFALAEQGDQKIRFGFQYVSPTGDFKASEYEAGPIADFPVYIPDPVDAEILVTATDITLTDKAEADAALGFFFGYEYMVTDLIGIDTNLSYGKHDIDTETTLCLTWAGEGTGNYTSTSKTKGDISMMPITVGVNFHVMQKEKVHLYLGPFLGYVMYGDAKFDKFTDNIIVTSDPIVDPFPITGSFSGSLSEKAKIKSDFGFGAVVGIDVPFGSKGWMFSSALKYMSTKAKIDEPGVNADIDINPWILNIGVGYKF